MRYGVHVSPYAYTVALTGDFVGYSQAHKNGHVAIPEQEKGCMGERLTALHKV